MSAGPEEIAACVLRLRLGGVVAFPTETVYGLGADALSEVAVRRVFELKGRPSANPLIVHVSGVEMAQRLTTAWTAGAAALAERFWPGPLTIVLPKADEIPDLVTAGLSGVGLRCPAHPLTLALIEAFGGPLVGPSANLSGAVSPTTADHVRAAFSEDDVFVLDGGPCRAGIESTVVSLVEARPRVLRPGVIGVDAIQACLGVTVEEAEVPLAPGQSAPGPGILGRHYAPATPCRLVAPVAVAEAGPGDVVLSYGSSPSKTAKVWIAMPKAPAAYAARLYAALREADSCGATAILIEHPPHQGSHPAETAIWRAVWDRLRRATAGE